MIHMSLIETKRASSPKGPLVHRRGQGVSGQLAQRSGMLGALGFSRQMDFGRAIGYGRNGKPAFWISDGAGMGPNREIHLAFEAADEDAVRAFHDAH